MLNDLLVSLGPQIEALTGKPDGIGHRFHGGYQLKCAGIVGANPRYAEDSAAGLNPPAEILIQHLIGTFAGATDDVYPVGNDLDDAAFTLADGITLDPEHPACSVCGQGLVI